MSAHLCETIRKFPQKLRKTRESPEKNRAAQKVPQTGQATWTSEEGEAVFEKFLSKKDTIVGSLLLALIPAAAMTVFLAFPMYRRWIAANFFSFIIPARARTLQIAGEAALLWALWTAFFYRGGAAIFALFLTLEFLPAVLCSTPSGPWEFACLCLFPAFWTSTATLLQGGARSRLAAWVKRIWSVVPFFGILQYLIYLCYVLRFGRRPGANTLMTLLGTNFIEARDFLTDQFGVFETAAGFAVLFVSWIAVCALLRSSRKNARASVTAALCAAAIGGALYAQTRAPSYSNLFFDFQKGFRQYQTAIESLKSAHDDPMRRISALNAKKDGTGEICVVVIGESASRRHMGRYGYKRPTTPWLSGEDKKLQESLYVLENAFSCMVHTEPAVTMALSQFCNYEPILLLPENGDKRRPYNEIMRAFSLIEILKSAGVRTHWFSNQQKMGAVNNLISAHSRVANEQEYLEDHPLTDRENGHQDGDLLPLLSRTLSRAGENENHVIFLHLRGSHWSYKNCAPADWPNLPAVKRPKNMKRETAERVDAYDRSISYTDDVLRRIAEILASSKFPVTSMVYFSDHGEDVTGVGHNFDAFRPVMAEIPVVVWLSEGYRKRWPKTAKQLRENERRIFTSDLICELALGLNHVSYENPIPERDLTSPRYGIWARNARFWKGEFLKSAVPGLKDPEQKGKKTGGKKGGKKVP